MEYLECSKIMRISASVGYLPAHLTPLKCPSPSIWNLPKLEDLNCSKMTRMSYSIDDLHARLTPLTSPGTSNVIMGELANMKKGTV